MSLVLRQGSVVGPQAPYSGQKGVAWWLEEGGNEPAASRNLQRALVAVGLAARVLYTSAEVGDALVVLVGGGGARRGILLRCRGGKLLGVVGGSMAPQAPEGLQNFALGIEPGVPCAAGAR